MGFGFYYFDYTYFIFIVPALIITMIAQFRVKSTFQKYSRIATAKNMSGAQAADNVARFGGAMRRRLCSGSDGICCSL